MRIIAGTLGGRQFVSPKGHRTHPMSDKARGGLFNALGDISGLMLLDAFAGSGAVGLEAVSRGVSSVIAVEKERGAYQTIRENAHNLGVDRKLKAVNATISGWLTHNNQTFDIIVADPPYDNLQHAVIQSLVACLKTKGLLVVSWPSLQAAPQFEHTEKVRTLVYGDATLYIFKGLSRE